MNLNIFTVLVYNAKLLTRTVLAVYIFNFTFCELCVYVSLGGLCAFVWYMDLKYWGRETVRDFGCHMDWYLIVNTKDA